MTCNFLHGAIFYCSIIKRSSGKLNCLAYKSARFRVHAITVSQCEETLVELFVK